MRRVCGACRIVPCVRWRVCDGDVSKQPAAAQRHASYGVVGPRRWRVAGHWALAPPVRRQVEAVEVVVVVQVAARAAPHEEPVVDERGRVEEEGRRGHRAVVATTIAAAAVHHFHFAPGLRLCVEAVHRRHRLVPCVAHAVERTAHRTTRARHTRVRLGEGGVPEVPP